MAITVAEVMAHNPATVNADSPISEAARIMRAADVGDVLVLDSGR
jgi:predicted transcriptional regulator